MNSYSRMTGFLLAFQAAKIPWPWLNCSAPARRHGNSISVTALHVRMDNVEYHSDVQYLNRFCQEHNVEFEWRRALLTQTQGEARPLFSLFMEPAQNSV